jgi:hypothetical protein
LSRRQACTEDPQILPTLHVHDEEESVGGRKANEQEAFFAPGVGVVKDASEGVEKRGRSLVEGDSMPDPALVALPTLPPSGRGGPHWNASCSRLPHMRGGPLAVAFLAGIALSVSDAAAQVDPGGFESPGQDLPDHGYPVEVEVHITSNKPDTFFGRADAFDHRPARVRGHGWPRPGDFTYPEAICKAPCTATVPIAGNPYRIAGIAQVPSGKLELFPSPRGIDVRVHFGSGPAYVIGVVFTALGLAFTASGAGMVAAWAALGEPSLAVKNSPGELRPIGTTFALIGLPYLAIGLPFFLTQGTRVEVVERPHPHGPDESKETRHPRVAWGAQGITF